MESMDRQRKLQLVLITAAFSLVGFLLEVGPVSGVFTSPALGLSLELPALGFFAYFALAASAAVGLHLGEDEPIVRKPEEEEATPSTREAVRERVRVRPEMHQLRMFFTALGGYTVLKAISLLALAPAASLYNIGANDLMRVFIFGFAFVALSWFVLWQLLRWYAESRGWTRLRDELIGGSVTPMIAVVLALKPLIFFVNSLRQHQLFTGPRSTLIIVLHLLVLILAVLLWRVRPATLRSTTIGLLATGGAIAVMTVLLAIVDHLQSAV